MINDKDDMSMEQIELADGRIVPAIAVAALDELERAWPGATLPQARPAIVAAVIAAIEINGRKGQR